MKKHLLLFFALLASSVGGWAQAPFTFTNWVFDSFTRIGGTEGDASFDYCNIPLCLEQKGIEVTNGGDLTVTFTWNGGSWRMEFYGVDLVDESTGTVAYSKYEHKFAGGDRVGQVYTITGVTPGTYTIRYWSSKYGNESKDPIGGTGGSTGTIAHSGEASTGISFTNTSWDGKAKAMEWKSIEAPTEVTNLINDKDWGKFTNIHYHDDENLVFSNAAFYNINYNYTGPDGGGNQRLDLRGVEVLDNDRNIVYCDYHVGFTGTSADSRDYKIYIPSAGTYTVRTLVQTGSAGNVKCKGNITYTEFNKNFNNSFIRIKDADNKYMTCENSNNKTVFSETKDTKSIYFYTGSALISLYNGFLASRYSDKPCGMNAPTAENVGTLYHIHNSPNKESKYVISFGGDTRFMFKGADAGTYSGPSAATGDGYQFTIEQLTSLPIAINAYGFASVNLPVAIELGDNTTAWYANYVNGSEVTLFKITGTLPANTPAILINKEAKNTTVDFEIDTTAENDDTADETDYHANLFEGTTAAKTTTSGSNYVLSGDGIKKFTGTTLKGFRAYLPVAQGQSIRSMVFEGEDVVTAIEAAEGAVPADGKAYDLNGRSVVRANGVVIVNGKTIAIK